MKSIQTKIFMSILSGMLTLSIVLCVVSTFYINTTLERDSVMITESVANTEALRVNDELGRIEASLAIVYTYIDALIVSPESLHEHVQELLYTEKVKEIFQNVVENTHGITSFYLRYNPTLTDPHAGFFMGVSAGGKELFERDTTNLEDWESKPHEQVGWYSDPITLGKAVWSTEYHNTGNTDKVISYVIPLYKNYTPYGVIGVEIDPSLITDIIDNVSVYDNGFAYLTNSDGSLYYAPEHALMEALDDEHRFAQISIPLDNGMNIEIHADFEDIQRDGYNAMLTIIFIALAMLIAFSVFTHILTARIVTPLKKLTESAEKLAEGNMEIHPSCRTRDEIGALAESLSKTSGKLEEYRQYIGAIAFRDSLTGVKNGTAYKEAQVELEKDIRLGQAPKFGVVVVDINCLKKVNDAYGHEIGNRLIIETSKVICTAFKHSPVYRIGGDEFAVILKDRDFENSERIITELTEEYPKKPSTVADGAVTVLFAIGIDRYRPGIDTGFDDVFRRADANMYKTKQAMKDAYAIPRD